MFKNSCLLGHFSHVQHCNPMHGSPPGFPGDPRHWDSPGKNTGVGCHVLLQGIYPMFLMSPTLVGRFFTTSTTWKAQIKV